MNQVLETAGLASVGGFFRRRGKHMHVPVGDPCPNCETPLQGPWCFNCGQAGEELHRSVWKLTAEAFEGLFHTDGRLWKTLPDLLVHPARLTRAYLDGHRVPQIPPFRMFLVVLLLVFFTGHLSTHKEAADHAKTAAAPHSGPMTKEEQRQAKKALRDARAQLNTKVGPAAAHAFDAQMAPVIQKMDQEAAARRAKAAAAAGDSDEAADSDDTPDSDADANVTSVQVSPDLHTKVQAPGGGSIIDDNSEVNLDGDKTHTSAMEHWLQVRIKAIRDNPDKFQMILENWAHNIAILFLPISAAILTVLFAFNRKFYVFDHLVFSMHSLSFQLLLLSLIFLLSMAVGGLAWWLVVLMPIHLYRHMRGVYGRGRILTLLSMMVLFVGTTIGFSFLAILWVALGVNEMAA